MSDDALFWIASMSRPITATALMMLVDTFGHGGAYATQMKIDPRRGLTVVFLV